MSRPLRINVKDGYYHITARGIERRAIFLSERHCGHFLELLGEMAERYDVVVHAYTLMGNHYHLIIQTPHANVSQAIQWLNVSYSAWFNAREQRVGHLFQGRFGSKLIDGEGSWLLVASVYLHLNRVRTEGMGLGTQDDKAESVGLKTAGKAEVRKRLETLREFRWSSYRSYCGYAPKPRWLTTKRILSRAGGKVSYRDYIQSYVTRGDEPSEFETLRGRVAVGSTAFMEKAKKLVGTISKEQPDRNFVARRVSMQDIVNVVEVLKGAYVADFKGRYGDWGFPLVLYLARKRSGLTLKEIGDWAGGMDYKTVSKTVGRFGKRVESDKSLSRKVKQCFNQLSKVEM